MSDWTRETLEEAVRAGANLSGANLYRANLTGANLTDANLTGAVGLPTATDNR